MYREIDESWLYTPVTARALTCVSVLKTAYFSSSVHFLSAAGKAVEELPILSWKFVTSNQLVSYVYQIVSAVVADSVARLVDRLLKMIFCSLCRYFCET